MKKKIRINLRLFEGEGGGAAAGSAAGSAAGAEGTAAQAQQPAGPTGQKARTRQTRQRKSPRKSGWKNTDASRKILRTCIAGMWRTTSTTASKRPNS